jgi:hypothetical protein
MPTSEDANADRSAQKSHTFEGMPYDPSADTWNIRDATTEYDVNWNRLAGRAAPEFVRGAKRTLRWYVENRSVSRTANLYRDLLHFIEHPKLFGKTPIVQITESPLIHFRNLLGGKREHRLGSLRGFLLRWHEQGHSGIDADAARWLREVKLRGNAKGTAVATQDPIAGPFTQIEQAAIHQHSTSALSAGKIGLDDFCAMQLQSALGSRSVQFAAMKCKDLIRPKDVTKDDWILMVPRAKQRLEKARSQLKPRPLIPELAQIVAAQVEDVQDTYRASGRTEIDVGDLPIFPDWSATNFPRFEFHQTSKQLGARVTSAAKKIDALSERTGERLHITSRRFRYTVGTRAAEEGLGELVIAELLDHTDIQQVGVYVRATQKIAERISKALAIHLAPLAQAFMGTLIQSEAEALRAADPSSRIREPEALDVLGNCGQMGICSEAAPIACYTCRRFQAWLDAPHEQLLDGLLIERERVMKATGDARVASVNDRTILAVANVVQLCQQRRAPRLQ